MLPDPFQLLYAGTAVTLPRITAGANASTYGSSDSKFGIAFKQTASKARFRREMRFTMSKISTDPVSTVASEVGASVYLVIDEPKFGFTDQELTDLVAALVHDLADGTIVPRLLEGEY
jgi:hypothetical protein